MALQQPKKPKTRKPVFLDEEVIKKTDLERFVEHVKQNPMLYAASAAFVLVCLVAGGLYGLYESTRNQKIQTGYAAALDEEDPALVAANLEALTEKGGPWATEIWYMLGEKSLLAQNYPKAEEAFNVVVKEYPESEDAPKALDGLGFIHENRGDFQKALETYRQIADNPEWAKTLVGMRQQFNIGRVLEKMEHFDAAKEAYEKQIDLFPGTADEPSMISEQARAALERMKLEHPELFPAEAEAEQATPSEEAGSTPSEASSTEPAAAESSAPTAEAAPVSVESAPEAASQDAAAVEADNAAPPATETPTAVSPAPEASSDSTEPETAAPEQPAP